MLWVQTSDPRRTCSDEVSGIKRDSQPENTKRKWARWPRRIDLRKANFSGSQLRSVWYWGNRHDSGPWSHLLWLQHIYALHPATVYFYRINNKASNGSTFLSCLATWTWNGLRHVNENMSRSCENTSMMASTASQVHEIFLRFAPPYVLTLRTNLCGAYCV